jgi:hypothetical protein
MAKSGVLSLFWLVFVGLMVSIHHVDEHLGCLFSSASFLAAGKRTGHF